MITLVRVDDRLLHGQVIHAWVPATCSDTLVVVAGRSMREIYESELGSIPGAETCDIFVLDQVGAVDFLLDRSAAERRVFVVVPSVAMALSIFSVGVRFGILNIGNVHHAEYSERLSPSVVVTEGEMRALEFLRSEGVRIEVRALPVEGRHEGQGGAGAA